MDKWQHWCVDRDSSERHGGEVSRKQLCQLLILQSWDFMLPRYLNEGTTISCLWLIQNTDSVCGFQRSTSRSPVDHLCYDGVNRQPRPVSLKFIVSLFDRLSNLTKNGLGFYPRLLLSDFRRLVPDVCHQAHLCSESFSATGCACSLVSPLDL